MTQAQATSANCTLKDLKVGQVGYVSVMAWLADTEWDMWIFDGLRVAKDHRPHLNLKVERTDEGIVCELLQPSTIKRYPSTEITPAHHVPIAYLVVAGVKHDKVPEHLRI